MSFIIGKYIRKDAIIKQITINRKPSFVLSIIANDIISHIISLEILMARNFIPASGLPYKNRLNSMYTIMLSNTIKNTTIRPSEKSILQK
ncbi:hypothetical protein HNP38_000900 [Chryseobacterium defluvii]|uniref:Uncharacterized protein n=1 Tax=Chryseobacterium defluvii TaxID=160396 RepID=A0A840KC99_9FLAO|nr:hypothetical protein [Chryseobacterium defluvii]